MAEISFQGSLAEQVQALAQQRGLATDALLASLIEAELQKQKDTRQQLFNLYRDAIRNIPIGVAIVEKRQPGMPIVYVNPAFESFNRSGMATLVGQQGIVIGQNYRPPEEVEKLVAAVRDGQPLVVTLTQTHPDGSTYWVETHAIPHFEADGTPSFITVLMFDVTVHIQFQHQARLNEAIYSTSFDLLADGVLIRDKNGALLACNEGAARITGLTKETLMERHQSGETHQWEVLREDGTPFPREEQPTRLAIQGKPQRNVVVGLRRADKPLFWIRVNSEPFCPPGETPPYGVIVSFTDITAEHEAYQRLVESEQRFRLAADHAPVLIWMSDAAGEYTYVNQTWLHFTGQRLEDELGSGWQRGIYEKDYEKYRATFVNAISAKAKFQVEYRLKHQDGSFRWLIDSGVPRIRPDGTLEGFIGMCSDITDLKNVQFELEGLVTQRTRQIHEFYQAALAEQKQKSDLQNRFLSLIVHEFRNPLAVMKIAAWFLRLSDPTQITPTKREEKIGQIEKQIERLTQLVDHISTAYELQSGSYHMKWVEIDAIPSIRSLAEEIQKLEDSRAEIQFEMPNSTLLQTDEQLFGHIVANLISNALKYSPEAKPIHIRVERLETMLVCAVTDQGIGIHPDDQARLFELFYRGRNVGKIRGTGIGLAIVKYCVDALGGQIEYQTELGIGTTFTATIPLKRDSRR